MKALLLTLVIQTLASTSPAGAEPLGPLPEGWRADIGTPVAVDDGYVWLYGDTFHAYGYARNTVVVDGQAFLDAVPATAAGHYYWPGDGYQMPDGRLFVVMAEIRDDPDASDEERALGFGFEQVDNDAFIVTDPRNPMSWKLAEKIEDGPWGTDGGVHFSDQWPLAFVRYSRSFDTHLFSFNPADPTGDWDEVPVNFPVSFDTFLPVQTETGWWGVAMTDWNTGAFWHADDATGQWTEVETFEMEGRTYSHALNIVDGRVVWRWSNAEGSMRPEYREVTL